MSKSAKRLPEKHSPQVEDPYTELDMIDNKKNTPDVSLKGGQTANARDKIAIPDTGNGADGRLHESGHNERYYANDWRDREYKTDQYKLP